MDYPLLDVFLTLLFIFLFGLWIYLLVIIFADIFRSRDLSGAEKAGWSVFVIFLPFIGILSYLIVRGGEMQDRAERRRQRDEDVYRDQVRTTIRAGSTADELTKLDDLHRRGLITDVEFERQRARTLAP